jgi:predicted CoA-binding protein
MQNKNRDSFLSSSGIAVYGVSTKRRTFAEGVIDSLGNAAIEAYPVHPDSGQRFFKDHNSIPPEVESVYIAANPENTARIIDDFPDNRFKKIWLQNGSFNDTILKQCAEKNYDIFTGCLMMYIPEAGFIHRFHRAVHEFFERRK